MKLLMPNPEYKVISLATVTAYEKVFVHFKRLCLVTAVARTSAARRTVTMPSVCWPVVM